MGGGGGGGHLILCPPPSKTWGDMSPCPPPPPRFAPMIAGAIVAGANVGSLIRIMPVIEELISKT